MAVYATEWCINTVNRWLDSDPRVGIMVGYMLKCMREADSFDSGDSPEHMRIFLLSKMVIALKYSRYAPIWNRLKAAVPNKINWLLVLPELCNVYAPKDGWEDIYGTIRAYSIDKRLSTGKY